MSAISKLEQLANLALARHSEFEPESQVSGPHGLLVNLPSLGVLRGRLEPAQNNARYFLGIPYGKALRWELPQPVESWEGIRDATEFGCAGNHLRKGHMCE